MQDGMLKSLESRWMKNADHQVFILAVFLNPYIRNRAFRKGNPALVPMALYDMAAHVYTRMFGRTPDAGFHEAFWEYSRNQGKFSDVGMKLRQFDEAYRAKVRGYLAERCFGCLSHSGTRCTRARKALSLMLRKYGLRWILDTRPGEIPSFSSVFAS